AELLDPRVDQLGWGHAFLGDAFFHGRTTDKARSDIGQQFLVPVELVFPVGVYPDERALGATKAQIKPANVFRILVKVYPDRNPERLAPAGAGGLLPFLHLVDVVGPVAHDVLVSTGDTGAARDPGGLVEGELEHVAGTAAMGVGKMLRRIAVLRAP